MRTNVPVVSRYERPAAFFITRGFIAEEWRSRGPVAVSVILRVADDTPDGASRNGVSAE